VLLIQGDDDPNVPFSQTVDLVQRLREKKVPVEVLVFPDEIHDFLMFKTWLKAYGATADFFAASTSHSTNSGKRGISSGGLFAGS
jgi:dipeptidyl aminopeptidase/acylaminoacyl peptidase